MNLQEQLDYYKKVAEKAEEILILSMPYFQDRIPYNTGLSEAITDYNKLKLHKMPEEHNGKA